MDASANTRSGRPSSRGIVLKAGAAVLSVALVVGMGACFGYLPWTAANKDSVSETGRAKAAYVGEHLAGFSEPHVSPSELDASKRIQEAYTFAMYNPTVLKYLPCYCGCGRAVGHHSSLDCFIKDIASDGSVLFDQHASGCQLCIEIALDAKQQSSQGKSLGEIRQSIDQTYGQKGPGTETPLPPA